MLQVKHFNILQSSLLFLTQDKKIKIRTYGPTSFCQPVFWYVSPEHLNDLWINTPGRSFGLPLQTGGEGELTFRGNNYPSKKKWISEFRWAGWPEQWPARLFRVHLQGVSHTVLSQAFNKVRGPVALWVWRSLQCLEPDFDNLSVEVRLLSGPLYPLLDLIRVAPLPWWV